MNFELNEYQKMLKKSARDFLAVECPSSLVREMAKDEEGFSTTLWHKIVDIGWTAIPYPEEYGGSSGSFLDLVVLLEETGRACLPGPFFSVLLGSFALLEAGNEEQKKQFGPQVANEGLIITLASGEPHSIHYGDIATQATNRSDGYQINGTKLFVSDAHIAAYLICVARTEGDNIGKGSQIKLFLVDSLSPGIVREVLPTMSGEKECSVIFTEVNVPRENILGDLSTDSDRALKRVIEKGTLAKSAEMVGAGERVLELTANYAKERFQFGRPIGSFQAIQHYCADMLIALETAKLITYESAWLLDKQVSCTKEVSMAKAWVSNSYKRIASLAHQIYGGMGVIEESDLCLYSRRAWQWYSLFGRPDSHYENVCTELGL